MPYKIGVPSLKLNNSGKKSKHTGSLKGVAREGLEERKGLDRDIDPTKSHENIYLGFRTAQELMDYSRHHIETLEEKTGRKIRKDAVVMCTTVFKPPAIYMNQLSYEQQKQFFMDCLEFITSQVGGEDNVKSYAIHFDELGAHAHLFWEPITKDGRLCAKEMHNVKFFSKINENLPAFLRGHGWDIADADCYDRSQREKDDLKAQEERYQKRLKQGRSSAVYKAQAELEKQKLIEDNQRLRLDNSKLLGRNTLLEIEEADLMDDISLLMTVLNDDDVQAAVQDVTERTDEIYQLIGEQDAVMYELEQALENKPEEEWKTIIKNVLFVWQRIFYQLQELIRQINNALTGLFLYGVFVKKPETNKIISKLQDRIDKAMKRTNSNNRGMKEIVETANSVRTQKNNY